MIYLIYNPNKDETLVYQDTELKETIPGLLSEEEAIKLKEEKEAEYGTTDTDN